MAIVMSLHHSEVTNISGFNYFAQLSYGENGDFYGPMEAAAGTPDTVTGSHVTWDDNPDDGVNSGWVPVDLSFKAGASGLSLEADGTGESTSAVGNFNGIKHLDLRTVAQGQTAMLWSNVMISFYKGGVLTEQVSAASLGVDNTAAPGVGEQVLSVTPANSDNDQVVVSGTVKLESPEGYYPGASDMFSQVLIYTA